MVHVDFIIYTIPVLYIPVFIYTGFLCIANNHKRTDESTNQRASERTNELTNQLANERTNERIDQQCQLANEPTKQQTN